ncbi:outer membrane beta-barrel protein [Helicobacter pylori]|uniref:outer membrane beta-barrel protein n=1 Tax=Helicobacter pylori TaxID=210 RepID=UPI0026A465C2
MFYDYGYTNFGFVGNGFDGLGKMNNHLYGLGIDYLFNFIDNAKKQFERGVLCGFCFSGEFVGREWFRHVGESNGFHQQLFD